MTTLQEKFYQEIKSIKNRILNFQEVSMRMAKTVEIFTRDIDIVIIPHTYHFDIRAIEHNTNKITYTADFIPYRTVGGLKTKLLKQINKAVKDYTDSKLNGQKKEIGLLYSFSEPKTKVYLMISPKNEGLFDLFDEEITDIADLDGRPYTTAYLTTEEKSELYELKELIKEKLKTVDIVQVIPRN